MTTHPLVIYHGPDCPDGFCSAWLIWRYYDTDADFYPTTYDMAPPDVAARDVLILDFSYPRDVLERLYSEAASLLVLDHHRSAEAALRGLPYCRFDMERSGAQLTWDWLCSLPDRNIASALLRDSPDGRYPEVVSYVADRDLWLWVLPHSREISAYIASWPFDFTIWKGLARLFSVHSYSAQGAAILRYQSQIVAQHIKRARLADLAGYRVPVVNASSLFSEIAGELSQGYPFAAVWFDRDDGVRQYSLGSRPPDGIDVSEIARRFGGGGHFHAAGFETSAPAASVGNVVHAPTAAT